MAGGLLSLAWWADGRPEAHRIATSTSAQGDAYAYGKCAGPCSQPIDGFGHIANSEPPRPGPQGRQEKTRGRASCLFAGPSRGAWQTATAVAAGGGTWGNAWLLGHERARERRWPGYRHIHSGSRSSRNRVPFSPPNTRGIRSACGRRIHHGCGYPACSPMQSARVHVRGEGGGG